MGEVIALRSKKRAPIGDTSVAGVTHYAVGFRSGLRVHELDRLQVKLMGRIKYYGTTPFVLDEDDEGVAEWLVGREARLRGLLGRVRAAMGEVVYDGEYAENVG